MATTHRETRRSKSPDIKIISIPDVVIDQLKNDKPPCGWSTSLQLAVKYDYNSDHIRKILTRAIFENKIQRRPYFTGDYRTTTYYYNEKQFEDVIHKGITKKILSPYMFCIKQLSIIFKKSVKNVGKILRKNKIKYIESRGMDMLIRRYYDINEVRELLTR